MSAAADKVAKALRRLMRSTPTDSDMVEAGWEQCEIDEACNAHDFAKLVLAEFEAEKAQPAPEPFFKTIEPEFAAVADQVMWGDPPAPEPAQLPPPDFYPRQDVATGQPVKVYYSPDAVRAILAAGRADAQPADKLDAERLDWLDATNKPFRMGWAVCQAPAGNLSILSAISLGSESVPIRAAIDAARAEKGGT